MDDYDVNMLSEAKNEYCVRLVNILSPLVIQGLTSIFDEAVTLCNENDESDKYLMTFQNFLTRVPKWNSALIDEETKRIKTESACSYLDDLITCVHISHLKLLTSIRVSQKQKKIDIDIPKLDQFIHKVYIAYARKVYQNVYLFEKDIMPLQKQKNMREAEILCNQSILNVIRDSVPVEKILRAYIDETVDEEVIEEIIEKNMPKEEADKLEEEVAEREEKREEENKEKEIKPEPSAELLAEEVNKEDVKEKKEEFKDSLKMLTDKLEVINKPSVKPFSMKFNIPAESNKPRIGFNNNDSVLDMGTNKETIVDAPKTIERLEEVAKIANEKRKAEEEGYDDDDDGPLKISGDDIKLDFSDVHDLDKKKTLEPAIKLDIETLS
tara:strand:+ start:19902 stop:21047 length:1146 start_codon:yes stop_codon:yes gene_type:complete